MPQRMTMDRALTCAALILCAGGPACDSDEAASSAVDAAPSEDGDATACAELDLGACRARPDCAVDLCFACDCAPAVEGCRSIEDVPFECPELGCAQPECCADQEACAGTGASCSRPGEPLGCGPCVPGPGDCDEDADCDPAGTERICEPVACSCEAARACVAGCEAEPGSCPTGQACDPSSHRCEPLACPDARCPDNFDCDDGACTRRPCEGDGDCPDGWCVLGLCEASLGECRVPPA